MTVELFDDEMFEDDPPPPKRPPRQPRKRRGGSRLRGETAKRVLVALPWIVFAIAITVAGGVVFAAAMILIGVLCLREFLTIASAYRLLAIPAYLAVAALVIAAHYGTAFNVLLVLAATFPVLFAFAADSRHQDGATVSMGVTLLGIVWIGLPLAHAVLLRDLPSHGAALLIDVLVGTFVADTAAYATGRMFGSHRVAPTISPNKTIEGLLGGFVIGTMGF
jgi:phosphatidate cytidylyltransferase